MRFAYLSIVLVGCVDRAGTYYLAERWTEAEALFHQDPHWQGGDTAATIDLGDERTLWLFGDSFIATSGNYTRTEAAIVHSSVAVMTGHDPETARMEFAWGSNPLPTDYFPPGSDPALAPRSGVRAADGSVVVFLAAIEEPTPGPFGSLISGTRVMRIGDPSGHPRDWKLEPLAFTPPSFAPDAELGCLARDGNHVVALSVDGPTREGRLVRWSSIALAGSLDDRSWWTGEAWLPEGELVAAPAVVVPAANTQCSLSFDVDMGYEPQGRWLYTASDADGSIRTRDAIGLEGPFEISKYGAHLMSAPTLLPDELAFGGRLHGITDHDRAPMMTVIVTTADPATLFDPERAETLYWPRVGRAQLLDSAE